MSDLEVIRRRMAAQRLTGEGHRSAADVVRALGAVQAQEFGEAKWSLATRMEGDPTEAEIDAAFDRGEFLRTHVLRPTWHFVAPEDLRWMLALTAARLHRTGRVFHHAQIGMDEALLRRGADALVDALSDGVPRTRKELRDVLAGAGMTLDAQAVSFVCGFAELEALICSGPQHGKQQTYALFGDRVPDGSPRAPEEAAIELARRYFAGHGPASDRDFAWWSGLTLADARAAVEALGDRDAEAEPARSDVMLIPTFDELVVAFKELRAVTPGGPSTRLLVRPLLTDGAHAGSWTRRVERDSATLEVSLLEDPSPALERSLEREAERYGAFAGMPVTLQVRVDPARALQPAA